MNKKRMVAGMLVVTMITGEVAASGNIACAASDHQKEEVVYVMTNANGQVDNVNVVNIFGKGSVTDYGNYSSVKMLNTTDTIKQDGDKITFTTDKDKVYYQGTLKDTEIPWDISIIYLLDGKEIKPFELAGKDGALEIHITIKKNKKCTSDFYDGFALQAALSLDTENCKNIKADGATLANVGANKQISYTVLPGKGLDAVICADVTDFEMDAIAINGVKLDLDVDIDDEELMDKVDDIIKASRKLNKAAKKVSNGTDKLEDGGSGLLDGADSLSEGVDSMDTGITSLDSGVQNMQKALNTLNAKSDSLTDGSGSMKKALLTLQKSLSGVSVSTKQLKQLISSSASVKKGISDLYDGAVSLQAALSYDSYKAAMKQEGLDMDELQSGNTAAIQSISEQIKKLSESMQQLKAIPDYESNEQYKTQVAQLEAQIESLQTTVKLLQGNNAAIYGMSQYLDTTSGGASALVSGLSELKTNYNKVDAAISELSDTLSGLAVHVNSLKGGIDKLVTSYKKLDKGINGYTDGVAKIVAAYTQLTDGTKTLALGSDKLMKGAAGLKDGTTELYDGIVTLQKGTDKLSDGTQEFYDQTDGMDEKISSTIDDTIKSLSGDQVETTSFVSDRNKDVSSVQFVIKTDAVEKEEVEITTETKQEKLSIWEKFLNLWK